MYRTGSLKVSRRRWAFSSSSACRNLEEGVVLTSGACCSFDSHKGFSTSPQASFPSAHVLSSDMSYCKRVLVPLWQLLGSLDTNSVLCRRLLVLVTLCLVNTHFFHHTESFLPLFLPASSSPVQSCCCPLQQHWCHYSEELQARRVSRLWVTHTVCGDCQGPAKKKGHLSFILPSHTWVALEQTPWCDIKKGALGTHNRGEMLFKVFIYSVRNIW